VLDFDVSLGLRAAEIAGEIRLRGADSVYVALAEALSLPLYTWDKEIIDRTKTIITAQQP
jgi:predicted nucleic acid-binding protein